MAGDTSSNTAIETGQPRIPGPSLDAGVAVLSLLMVAGIALDFRRHAQGISFAEEGFFTAEHVFFYAMFLGIAALIGVATVRERRARASWIEAVPTGYTWGILGVIVFGLGGAGDFLWHSAFGFEQGFEALVSPSHLALAVGAALFLASPLRATWYRDGEPDGVALLPALLSLGLVLAIVALFGGFLNPILRPYAAWQASGPVQTLGVAGLVAFPLLFVGTGLATVRRFPLPAGALTLTFLVPGLASTATAPALWYAIPVVVAGLVADLLASRWPPRPGSIRAIRGFGAVVPLSFVGTYFLVLELGAAITWTVHVWVGTVVLAGIAGLLLTYAVFPGDHE